MTSAGEQLIEIFLKINSGPYFRQEVADSYRKKIFWVYTKNIDTLKVIQFLQSNLYQIYSIPWKVITPIWSPQLTSSFTFSTIVARCSLIFQISGFITPQNKANSIPPSLIWRHGNKASPSSRLSRFTHKQQEKQNVFQTVLVQSAMAENSIKCCISCNAED